MGGTKVDALVEYVSKECAECSREVLAAKEKLEYLEAKLVSLVKIARELNSGKTVTVEAKDTKSPVKKTARTPVKATTKTATKTTTKTVSKAAKTAKAKTASPKKEPVKKNSAGVTVLEGSGEHNIRVHQKFEYDGVTYVRSDAETATSEDGTATLTLVPGKTKTGKESKIAFTISESETGDETQSDDEFHDAEDGVDDGDDGADGAGDDDEYAGSEDGSEV